jgi:hypothetical protein
VSDHDISAIQDSIIQHVTNAVDTSTFTVHPGAPRGYAPPQINVWWTGVRSLEAPMEIQEVPYVWNIRVVGDSGADPDRQDVTALVWEAIFDEWKEMDAISCGGYAQLSYPSRVEGFVLEHEGMLYVGIDITLTVIVKKARVFS